MRKPTLFGLFFISVHAAPSHAQVYHVQDLSTTEIAALDRTKTMVLLPGGILEEHGPYLPCFADGFINQRVTDEVAQAIARRPGWKALIFPLIPLGAGGANEIGRQYSFPGNYNVRPSTLRAVLMDLGGELGEQGFKNIMVIHAHGAPLHNLAIQQACDYFNDTYRGQMVLAYNLPVGGQDLMGQDLRTKAELQEDGFTVHAGLEETSMLLYLNPRVKTMGYQQAKPYTAANPDELVAIARANNWPGYFGSPRLATAAKGEAIMKQWVAVATHNAELMMDHQYVLQRPTLHERMAGHPVFKAINDDADTRNKALEARQLAWLKSKGLN